MCSLQNVEAEALLGERAVGEARKERVGQYLGVDRIYQAPEIGGITFSSAPIGWFLH
jgi:hypothetical protein